MTTEHSTTTHDLSAAAERVRELNERLYEASKRAGHVYVDTMERSVRSFADLDERLGEQSNVPWLQAAAKARADIMRQVLDAYTDSARALLRY